MSLVDTGVGAQPTIVQVASTPKVADPAPLGLAAFALTTFLLSAQNAHWTKGTAPFLGYALAYGGLCQLLAGMWEFKNNNTFGATAFSTYGGFWIGLGLYVELVAGSAKTAVQVHNDEGWILLAFLIFNTYMLVCSLGVNLAVFSVFLTLEATEVVLVFANFTNKTTLAHVGGYLGIVTAAVAWYTSFAGILNGMRGRPVLFVGQPMIKPVQN